MLRLCVAAIKTGFFINLVTRLISPALGDGQDREDWARLLLWPSNTMYFT